METSFCPKLTIHNSLYLFSRRRPETGFYYIIHTYNCVLAEIEDRFHNLETQLGDQLNVLKTMLISLEDKIVEQDQELKRQHKRLMTVVSSGRKVGNGGGSTTVVDHSASYTPAYIPSVPHRAEEVTDNDNDVSGGSVPRSGPRFDEMSKYNSTVHIENGKRVFSYYWTVNGMDYKLKSWNLRRALRSNNFYIYPGGYRMYIKVIPRYTLNTMYIHTGITKGDYDDALSWPFQLKLRMSVLSMQEETGSQDLKSRLWDPTQLCSGTNWRKPVFGDNPECLGLGFPHEVIQSTEFIHTDRIIIKLTVLLD